MDFAQRPLSGFSSRSYNGAGMLDAASVTRFTDWQTVRVNVEAGTWQAGTTDRGDNWVGAPDFGKVGYWGQPVSAEYSVVVDRLLNVFKAHIGRTVHVSTPADNAAGSSWSETVVAVDERAASVYIWVDGAVHAFKGSALIERYAGRVIEPAF